MGAKQPVFLEWAILTLTVAAWFASFVLLRRGGTWATFAIAGGVLVALSLVVDPNVRTLLRPSPSTVAVGLAAGMVMVVVTHAGFAVISSALPDSRTATVRLYGFLNVAGFSPGMRAALIIVVATSEEILFRGALVGSRGSEARVPTDPRGRGFVRVAFLAAIYALPALPLGSLLLVVWAFGCALYWGMLRLTTGSLVTSVLAHVGWDLGVMVLWPLV